MKNIKGNIFIFLTSVLLITVSFCGCRKVSHNGKLDGQWQIMKIENLETGAIEVPETRAYICLNLHVVQLTLLGGENTSTGGNMRYDKDAGEIYWDFPYNTEGDTFKELATWGIYENPVTLKILKINNKSLILKTPQTIINCRRF